MLLNVNLEKEEERRREESRRRGEGREEEMRFEERRVEERRGILSPQGPLWHIDHAVTVIVNIEQSG